MWSSSPDRFGARRLALAIGCLLGGAGSASAAEYFAQPMFEAGAKYHTNRGLNLDQTGTEDVAGFELDGSAILGVVGPAGKTLVRPRVKYQQFEQRRNLDNTDYGLDVHSQYTSPRHDLNLFVSGIRRDTLSTEFIEPGFDDFDPNDPTVTDAGRITVNNNITRLQLRPEYDFRATERTRLGVNGVGQTVRFSRQGQQTRVDYNYANAGLSWEFLATERTTVFIDPYASRYETLNDTYISDGNGAAFGFDYLLTETSHFGITFGVERSHIERIPIVNTPTGPVAQPLVEEDTTDFSGVAKLVRKGEINQLQLSAGRVISPSTRGTKVTADHFNAQWTRLLSERLEMITSARYVSEQSIGQLATNDDRMHGSAEVTMRWKITPRWYIHGTVEVLMQDFQQEPDTATDINVFVGLGYKGLGSQAESTD